VEFPVRFLVVAEIAEPLFSRSAVAPGEKGGDGGAPGVHEMVDELQGDRLVRGDARRLVDPVVADLGRLEEVEAPDAGAPLEAEAAALQFGPGIGQLLAVEEEGEPSVPSPKCQFPARHPPRRGGP